MSELTFTDLEIIQGDVKVVWEWLGEGWSGDYNEKDPQDSPLLRFSCFRRAGKEWNEFQDNSYCTRLPIDTLPEYLEMAANSIIDAVNSSWPKRRLEELSWLCPDDFKHVVRSAS